MKGYFREKDGKMMLVLHDEVYGRYKPTKSIEVVNEREAREYCIERGIKYIYRGA